MEHVEKYKIFQKELVGTKEGNPFKDIIIKTSFINENEKIETEGFYKGNGLYEIRFMPQKTGKWQYVVESNDSQMNGIQGEFVCDEASKKNHGRVCLKKDVMSKNKINFYDNEDDFHFAYEDGTNYYPFGTTCYAWINQTNELQEETLHTLKHSPFNKIRMCIFPKYYSYNTEDPQNYAFIKDEKGFDFTRFDNTFFENLEKRIQQLDELGIQADIILFHPYDRWGLSKMTKQQDIYYLSYVIRRLSHYKNVWWSLANEYDLMPQKSIEAWDEYARVIMKYDVYGHLRSIHNCIPFYDYHKSWITHVSVQRVDVYKTAEMVSQWHEEYHKPVIIDEVGYEGNIDYGWGSLTGQELTRRYWEGCLRGGYLSHGETYVDKGPSIWWSHGGKLYGESVERIGFLKTIIENAPQGVKPLKLTAENHEENWDSICLCKEDHWYLYYYGFFKMMYRNYTLPQGKKYKIELIDTWNMKIKELPDIYEGKIRICLGGKQYMAVRMIEIK